MNKIVIRLAETAAMALSVEWTSAYGYIPVG